MGSSMIEVPHEHAYGPTEDSHASFLQPFGDWEIRSDILYLDNGAFGACPTPIAETQREIRRWIESNPHDFFERSYVPALLSSRDALAQFLNADVSGFILLPGATHGMNVVIQSLRYAENDEILTTNHAYSSVRLALEHVARRDGARLVIVDIPLIVPSSDFVLQKILSHVSPRTRLAIIDHVPSRSGLVFPIKEIVRNLESRGVDTLVDGAHAPGMVEVDLKDLDAPYYVANCHKWMCAPRGTGFLHVRKDRMHNIKPLVIARSPFMVNKTCYSALEHGFSWMGTYDPSAMLSLPASINFLRTLVPGGYSALTSRNHDLAVAARKLVCHALGIPVPCPDDMIGSMATIPLPDSIEPEREGMLPIQQTLWREHGIVIPVYAWPSHPKRVIRLSVQGYNVLEQYVRLAGCLRSVLSKETCRISKSLVPQSMNPPHQIIGKDVQNGIFSRESTESCCHETDQWGNNAMGSLETPHQDVEYPAPWLLYQLALQRIRRVACSKFSDYPVSLYPGADEAETQFASVNEPKTRHANMEISRMNYMLSCIKSRKIPEVAVPSVVQLLDSRDVIMCWPRVSKKLGNLTYALTRAINCEMNAPRTPAEFPSDGGSFNCRIIPYETEGGEGNLGRKLWHRALQNFTARVSRWSLAGVESFLQIHSFLKDPIGGPRKDICTQARLFISMFNDLKPELESMKLAPETWEEILAQLARESSFLAHSEVQHAAYIHFEGDEQLVYSYMDIDSLGRSEFATPPIVIGMIQEWLILEVKPCAIAPVTVSFSYPICSSYEARAVIVDGNNRSTALQFLRFASTHGIPNNDDVEPVRAYCQDHGLGPICFVDLCAVLRELWSNSLAVLQELKAMPTRLNTFRNVRRIPTLITEESCFLTRAVSDEGVAILQPVHQSIFASDDLLVALPAKGQSHGRSKGYRALPILS
ncbi:hypothetical protein HIM_09002 [Hirsutella minnesotensis 3608]|uniref:Aminotransferase class V domain-containing protein n=1 Tax=Hirsutella minnesotensis 3608 TaxID=1043627 RepID=A0A0F7ZSM2_9HYPO|nr:hypothetical protein HIM_09002 [Hirsutella minnesotensis 3608]